MVRAARWPVRLLLPLAALLLACGGDGGGGEGIGPGCAETESCLEPESDETFLALLYGRWKLVEGQTAPPGADGIEFRPGFWHFLRELEDGTLVSWHDHSGWEIAVARRGGGVWRLQLQHVHTGRPVVADASIFDETPRRLQLDFREPEARTARFVSVR